MKFKFILTIFLIHCPMYAYCVCDENKFSCVTLDGKYGTCVNNTCRTIQAEERKNLRFIIVVKYPEAILNVSDAKYCYELNMQNGRFCIESIKLKKYFSSETLRD